VDSAEGVLKNVDASCRGLMSPLLRSRQLLLWAQLYFVRACYALNMGQPAVQDVIKALTACERARALGPTCWRKVNPPKALPPCPLCPRFPRKLSLFLAQVLKVSGCFRLVRRSIIAAAEHVITFVL